MKKKTYQLSSIIVLYPGMAGWHFLYVPKVAGQEIKRNFGNTHRGFGSLPVTVKLGTSTWETSIFPDMSSGSYVLPLKAAVRKKEAVQAGERVKFSITLR